MCKLLQYDDASTIVLGRLDHILGLVAVFGLYSAGLPLAAPRIPYFLLQKRRPPSILSPKCVYAAPNYSRACFVAGTTQSI